LNAKSELFRLRMEMDRRYRVNTERPAYGKLGHSPVHFRDWHKVTLVKKG